MDIFGNRGRGGRRQALMLGLPAVVVSVLGIALVCTAEFGVAKDLEERYLFEAEKSTKEKQRLTVDLRRELRMLTVTLPSNADRSASLIPEDDPRIIDLESSRNKERVYLAKLISLNNAEPDYKFKLAMACLEKPDSRERGLAMLRTISPSDEPGHIKGHVFLANFYLNQRTSSQAEAIKNVRLGMEHVDLCLRRDSSNRDALKLKAKLLYLQRKYADAYVVFSELFETEPTYFQALVELNQKLDRTDRNTEVISIAIDAYDDQLKNNKKLTDSERVRIFQELTNCYTARKDFETIEGRLLAEIKLQSAPKDSGKRVWAEHLLANVYGGWLQLYPAASSNPADRLALLKKAYSYNPKNEQTLRELTRLGTSDDESISLKAREVYDPTEHSDAPAMVLNELGAQALARLEHDRALRYFELARKKTPRAPQVLNNLSYAYLVGDTPNPKRALKLIDEALRYLPNTPANEKYRTHFHDTRAKALMQLGQVSEAVAEFEFALRSRPNDVEILESLIDCYNENGMDPSPYERHLSRIVKAQGGGGANGGGGGEEKQ